MAWPTWYVDLTVASGQWSGSPVVAIPVASALLSATSLLDPTAQHHAQNGGGDWLAFRGHSFTERVPLDVIECTTAVNPSERALHLAVSTTSLGSGQTLRLAGGSTEGLKSQPAAGATFGRHAVYPTELKGYWPLNASSGGDADRTSNAHDLTENGTVGSASAKVGRGRSFVGTNYLSTPDTHALSAGTDFSVRAWARGTASARRVLLAKTISGFPENEWAFDSEWNGSFYELRFMPANSTGVFYSGLQLGVSSADNQWNWLYAEHTSGTWGASANNTALSTLSGVYRDSTSPLTVGRGRSPLGLHNWVGAIDEVAFWKRPLTSGERTTLYNAESNNAAFWSVGPVTAIRRGGLLRRILAEGGVL